MEMPIRLSSGFKWNDSSSNWSASTIHWNCNNIDVKLQKNQAQQQEQYQSRVDQQCREEVDNPLLVKKKELVGETLMKEKKVVENESQQSQQRSCYATFLERRFQVFLSFR